jgi:hypothetical protein
MLCGSKSIHRILPAAALILLLCGCQSPTMKGTPFYTGEYESPVEGHTDRVNLWPALYYRKPALSVLWPLFELTDEHTALRPVFSIYGKTSGKPIYNVIWPIARFDTRSHSHRTFPVYWGKNSSLGDDYFVIAPLYWHIDDPFAGNGISSLFPLWIWQKNSTSRRLDLLWPVYADKKSLDERLWRIWPLYGIHSKNSGKDISRFWVWPLGGSRKSSSIRKQYLLPLYYSENQGLQRDLWTLLGGRSVSPDSTRWVIVPALSWGEKTGSSVKNRYLLGLAGTGTNPNENASYLLPIYAKRKSAGSSYLFSLPYSASSSPDGSGWKASLPLFHSQTDATGANRLITPLYSRKKDPSGAKLWQCYFPLLYLNETYDAHFMTLLGGRWRSGDNRGWLATPILSGGTKTPELEKTIWAAGLAGRTATPEKTSHYAIPLYFTCPQENRFLSLPYLRWQAEDQTRYQALPLLLSGTAAKGDVKKTLIAGGIASRETQAGQLDRSSLLPFYCWKRDDYLFTLPYGKTKTYSYFATPLAGRYLDKKGGWVFPIWQHGASDKRKETNLLLGIGNHYQTKTSNGHSLFPVYSVSRSVQADWNDKTLIRQQENLSALLLFRTGRNRLTGTDDALLEEHSISGLFPLWTKRLDMPRNGIKTTETATILLRLYDYRQETPHENRKEIYTRHRVLWRLYHNETLGGDSSTDIFPAITIDKKETGFRKYSFLWRMYRYEKNPETGTTKLDILFIPLKRS